MTIEPLLTLEQVADILRVSEKTVLRLIERGELVGSKETRAWRFAPADVRAYIAEGRSDLEPEN